MVLLEQEIAVGTTFSNKISYCTSSKQVLFDYTVRINHNASLVPIPSLPTN